jgi:hypothetical protein
MNIREIENLENVQPLEKIKLKMDFKRIKNERFRTWLSAIFIAIPLLLGVGTFFYGIWSENERAKNNFQIKAVEIVLWPVSELSTPKRIKVEATFHAAFASSI